MIEQIYQEWQTSLRMAYDNSVVERLYELHGGKKIPQFDGSGLHPFSMLVGQIYLCQDLCPELREFEFHHLTLLRLARKDAEEEFLSEKWKEREENEDGNAVSI